MSDLPGPPLHPNLEPFAFLLGTWRGAGEGSYPTIDTFGYVEEVTFAHVGKPFLAYGQKTKHAETELPLHAETGYWRPIGEAGSDGFEVILAHPTGITESLVGPFSAADGGGGTFDLRSDAVGLSQTAVSVTETTRRFVVSGDVLTYDVSMAAVGQPLTHHLRAELHRV